MVVAPSLLSIQSSVQTEFEQFDARSIFPQSKHLWQIQSGLVRTTTWLEDGTMVALGIWGAGDVIGQALSNIDPYQIECLTKVEAVLTPKLQVNDFEQRLLNHLQQAENLMLIRSYKRADVMLLKLLTWLSDRFGQTIQKGRLINLRLTHQDLADLLGITRVTVTRILNQLEQQGYIERLSLQRIVLQRDDIWHYQI